jgi:choice-of-anchor B domain-containing protein
MRIARHFIFLLLAASSLIELNGQITPCEAGIAGIYPCEGYDLLSHLSISELQGINSANDIWGWTHPDTGIEYALIGLRNGTAFVDLSNPVNPVLIGLLPTHTSFSSWRDIKVYQNHAYIVSEASGHGMQVFNLMQLSSVSNPPVEFAETSHFDGFGSAHNIAINEETGYAYVVGAATFAGGPIFINLQVPAEPVSAGGFDQDGYTHDAQVVVYQGPDTDYTGKEICFASNEDTFTIVDVDDKADPGQISRTGYEGVNYTHQGWLTEDHRYYLMNDELDEINGDQEFTRTIIWDCLDLDAPVVIGEHFGTTAAVDHNLYIRGDKAYQANYRAGLRVLDISNIANTNLVEIGYFDVYPADDGTSTSGAWSVYPFFESGVIIISSINAGLFVVKASDSLTADCPGDIDGDGLVGISDFISLNSLFGTACSDCPQDITGDGFVGIEDFLALNSVFGTSCEGVLEESSK